MHTLFKYKGLKDKNSEFATNSDFPIPIALSLTWDISNSVTLNNYSLKYHRYTPSGCNGTGIRKFEFMAKAQFLTKLCLIYRYLQRTIYYLETMIWLKRGFKKSIFFWDLDIYYLRIETILIVQLFICFK